MPEQKVRITLEEIAALKDEPIWNALNLLDGEEITYLEKYAIKLDLKESRGYLLPKVLVSIAKPDRWGEGFSARCYEVASIPALLDNIKKQVEEYEIANFD